MKTPVNSAAETIVAIQAETDRLRGDISSYIANLEARIQQNNDVIALLEPSAEWVDA